jgi:hypothetical protein
MPKNTSVYRQEPQPAKNEILFAPECVKPIREKKKWRTYRFGEKYHHLQVGDHVFIKDYAGKQVIGQAKITGKQAITFKDLPLKLPGHEIYTNKQHQRKVFSGYYAYLGRPLRDDDSFLIIDFKLI